MHLLTLDLIWHGIALIRVILHDEAVNVQEGVLHLACKIVKGINTNEFALKKCDKTASMSKMVYI